MLNPRELQVGDKVQDIWYDELGIGTVKVILKTRIKIDFTLKGMVTYDYPHARQFLDKI